MSKSKKQYNLICMTFDGAYVREHNRFFDTVDNIPEVWEHYNDMGSRWYFYPFPFVVTPGGMIADTPDGLEFFKGKRLTTVKKQFARAAAQEDTQGYDADQFVWYLRDMERAK